MNETQKRKLHLPVLYLTALWHMIRLFYIITFGEGKKQYGVIFSALIHMALHG